MPKQVFAWPTDTAGCFLYRLRWPLDTLPVDQFQVTIGAPGPDVLEYDIVVGQRITGFSHTWRTVCADPTVLAVYDIDDDLLNTDPGNPFIYNLFAPQAEETAANIAMADVVTVSTPKLGEELGKLNSNVVVLPNCLPRSWISPGPKQVRQPPVVAWGGSMFHGPDFGEVGPALREFHRHNPDVKFESHGANYLAQYVPAQVHGWGTMELYHARMDFDIGLASVARTTFNNHKSHCKLLEYASKGIPGIATAWGQYDEWIIDGVNGFLVKEPEDWILGLTCLLDPDTRTTMGAAAKAKAQFYTIENQIHHWVNVYNGAF